MRSVWIIAIAGAGCVVETHAESAPAPSEPVDAVVEAPADPCVSGVEALGIDDPRLFGADVVVVRKAARRLMHFEHGALVEGQCYRVGLGQGPDAYVGTKLRQGDLKTPEGWYRTSDKPTSRYYGAIAVHYPNALDARSGRDRGLIDDRQLGRIDAALAEGRKPAQDTALGGEILIHGGGSAADWTLGCMALDDADLDRLRASLPADQGFDLLVLP